jgi:hypothetical protein
MVEQVQATIFYQFTCTKPYKQAFTAGQRVKIGDAYTPYFGYYEKPREYPVTQPDGSIINIRANAFLRQVKEGKINCPNLAAIADEVATHYNMFVRELIMEQLRLQEFPDVPSRQRCLFLTENLDEARTWKERVKDPAIICSIECTGTIHRADANLLLSDSESLSVTQDRGRRYWRGELSEDPHREILFIGDATVTAVDL